jgi:hypothetical protein
MDSGIVGSREENMSQNEAFAAAAHLHVLLRRKTGRVTDTEWMASNSEYAQAVVRFAREKAASDGHTDLVPLADRLETLMGQIVAPTRKPLLDSFTAQAPSSRPSPETVDPNARYVGRLR